MDPKPIKNSVAVSVPTKDESTEEVEVTQCPHCHGAFAVDSTYLLSKQEVHCPICGGQVIWSELPDPSGELIEEWTPRKHA